MNLDFDIFDYQRKNGFWDTQIQKTAYRDFNSLAIIQGQRQIISKDKKLKFINFNDQTIWESSVTPGKPDKAVVSGDLLIITTTTEDYHAWGFLGPVILIDLNTGKILKELKGEKVKALSNGEFILGLEGYDFFHTWLYDRAGTLIQEWKTYGEYIVLNNEVMVIEENRQNPDSSYLTRLHLDGSIEKVIKLKSPRSSNPVKLNETVFIFENAGELIVINGELKIIQSLQLLDYPPADASSFSSRIKECDDELKIEILERTSEPIENYRNHVWKAQIPKI